MNSLNIKSMKLATVLSTALIIGVGAPTHAQSLLYPGIQRAVASVQNKNPDLAKFYAARKFKPMFVGNQGSGRRNALINALKTSGAHGLPVARYDPKGLQAAFRAARTPEARGKVELLAAQTLIRYSNDLSTGILSPSSIDSEIAIRPKKLSGKSILDAYAKSSPKAFLASLAPKSAEYQALLAEKKKLSKGSRGSEVPNVPLATLRPGTNSPNVAIMRDKLSALGYGKLGNSTVYDKNLVAVVKKFQKAKGLGADGIVGRGTINAMNVGPGAKMRKIVVNMERQRWMNFPLGKRHISVNIADYSVSIFDSGKVSFKSRTVVGQNKKDFRTPEFHDTMTHMVINPTWNVPKSIAVKEYVPIMRKDSKFLAKRGMFMVNASGKKVNPNSINLAKYNKDNYKTFPYYLKQKPDPKNALGRVKFMFPNKYNIYLHDTPSKSLFNKETRTFSHGCVRVHKPFEFAYKLLAPQAKNPQGTFTNFLNTKKEKFVNLKTPVPVYLTYRTVFFDGNATPTYRSDVYGRDAKLVRALQKAGVSL